jgi:tetratricopeptide (TPR) repeat protein
VLAASGRRPGEVRRRPFLAVTAALLAGTVLVSFASPRLSERSLRASDRALDRNDVGDALSNALRARSFNPYSTAPVLALAHIAQRQSRPDAAARRYLQAIELQPENPETWYALGLFEFYARENMCAAYRYLDTSWHLDPAGDQWLPGGELDQSRDAVNSGACEPS